MAKSLEAVSEFHEYGLYIPTRTIEIFGEITEALADRTIKNLHILDNLGSGTITIKFKSEGGLVTQGMAIYDAIKYCKNLVRGICIGNVESIATIIIQACDERLLYHNSYFMLHEGSSTIEKDLKFKDKKQWDNFLEAQENGGNKIYLEKIKQKKPRFTMAKLTEFIDRDRILLPKDIVEFGLADRIIEESY